jgi:hypothetical protein
MLTGRLDDQSGEFEGGVVVALNSSRDGSAPLAAKLDDETRLSPQGAALCIVALSLVSWAIVLVPLWALLR